MKLIPSLRLNWKPNLRKTEQNKGRNWERFEYWLSTNRSKIEQKLGRNWAKSEKKLRRNWEETELKLSWNWAETEKKLRWNWAETEQKLSRNLQNNRKDRWMYKNRNWPKIDLWNARNFALFMKRIKCKRKALSRCTVQRKPGIIVQNCWGLCGRIDRDVVKYGKVDKVSWMGIEHPPGVNNKSGQSKQKRSETLLYDRKIC